MAYIGYQDLGDGTFQFHDEEGMTTPPMAGPAAEQQKNKIDIARVGGGPLAATNFVPGSRAELSPEMLEAGAPGEDLRTAEFTRAPNGSIMDAGGKPDVGKLIDSGMGASEAQAYARQKENERASMDWLASKGRAVKESLGFTKEAGLEDVNKKRAEAGLPPAAAPSGAKPGEGKAQELTVPENERVQINVPVKQGLQFAPTAASGGGSAPSLKEVKAGETYGYTSIDPDAQKNITDAYQNKYEVGDQMAANADKAGRNLTSQLAEIPTGLTNLEVERQKQEETIAHRVQLDHEKLDELREETRKDVDPNAFWKSRSAAEKFMGAIAMGVGAYAQAMGAGPNQPMAILNNAIKEEIDAQKSNRDAAHQRFQDMRGQMAERKQLFQDERQNFLAKKTAYLEMADRKLGTYMQEAKTDEQKAQIADMQANVRIEAERMRAEFGKVSHQVQTKVVQMGGPTTRGTGVSELDHEKYVPQFGGLAPTKEEAVLARQKGAALESMGRLVSENVRLREQPDSFIKGSDNYAKLKSNQSQILLTLKRKENEDLGVIAGPDMQLMLDAMGDGSSIVPGQTAAMQNFLSNQKRVNENVRRNIGLIPVETAPIRDDKTGEVRIGQMVTGNIVTPNNVSGQYRNPVQTVHIAKTARQDKK